MAFDRHIQGASFVFFIFLCLNAGYSKNRTSFDVVAYNVQNLFDTDGVSRYDDYKPDYYGETELSNKLNAICRVLRKSVDLPVLPSFCFRKLKSTERLKVILPQPTGSFRHSRRRDWDPIISGLGMIRSDLLKMARSSLPDFIQVPHHRKSPAPDSNGQADPRNHDRGQRRSFHPLQPPLEIGRVVARDGETPYSKRNNSPHENRRSHGKGSEG